MAGLRNLRKLLALLAGLALASPAMAQVAPKPSAPPSEVAAAAEGFKACKALHPSECPLLVELSKRDQAGSDIAIALLQHEDPWLKRAGARVLSRTADKRAAMPLVPLLSDGDPAVRAAALDALGLCGGAGQAIHVVGLMEREREKGVRVAGYRALGRMKAAKALPLLTAALEDPEYNVAEAAAVALGLISDPAALIPLASQVNDPRANDFVREAAARSLVRLQDRRAIPTFLQALGDPNVEVRRSAIQGLGLLNATGTFESLLDALADETVLKETVTALGQLSEPRALDPLLTVLRAEDLDSEVRVAVLRALGRQKVLAAVPELLSMLGERSALSVEIIRALGEIGDQRALSRLVEALGSKDPTVVGAANSALTSLTGQRFDPKPEVWNRWLTDRELRPEPSVPSVPSSDEK